MPKHRYVSQGRNGYGAIDLYEGDRCLSNVMAGIKPAKLADEIAAHLNAAYWRGRDDAYGGANIAILSSIAKAPSRFPAHTIKLELAYIVAAANEEEPTDA